MIIKRDGKKIQLECDSDFEISRAYAALMPLLLEGVSSLSPDNLLFVGTRNRLDILAKEVSACREVLKSESESQGS